MTTLMLALALLAFPFAAQAQKVVFEYDFEKGADLAAYPGLQATDPGGIVAPGAGGAGHALRLANAAPSLYCRFDVRVPFTIERNLVLSYDYRAEVEAPGKGAYVAFIFNADTGKQYGYWSGKLTDQWTRAEIPFREIRSQDGTRPTPGIRLVSVQIYARAAEKPARMVFHVDNVRLAARPREGTAIVSTRVSTANPPLLSWARGAGEGVLQYSRDPAFPAGKRVEVRAPLNFHTPARPLAPGTWYWRSWLSDDLAEGWSDVERLEIPERAHRFTTPPVDVDALARRQRPRLFDVPARRAELGESGVQSARTRALAEVRQPIEADPKRFDPKEGRYREWIDWYRDTCNRICGGTGNRMERVAEACALTGDPEVMGGARTLLLAVASWDPNGGSAMGATDIGAHHLLRGLSALYDVLRDRLSPEERETVRAAIAARTLQFYDRLCPFRGSAENNHAWLQAYGVAMAGIALAGDHPEAGVWVEYVRQLYLGRFLCALGYQGDNNEGLSYWSYGLGFVIGYADVMRRVCGVDLYRHPWLAQTGRFPLYCAPPGAWAVSFADTGSPNHGMRGPAATRWVRDLGERTRDPYMLWYAGVQSGPGGLRAKSPADLPQSILYDYIGWAIFNTSLVDGREGVTFALRSGPFYAGHQHDDQNGFVLHAYGEKLAVDSGYYDWWGSPHFNEYSTLTRAHNAILVDGKDQAHMQKGADGRIAAWFDSPNYGYVVGDASDPEVYAGRLKRFDRRVLFLKPNLVVIQDLLEANGTPAQYDWLLHTVAPVRANPDGSFGLTSGEATLGGRFLRPAAIALKVSEGYPVAPQKTQSSEPVPSDEVVKEWTLTATPAAKSVRQEFLTALYVTCYTEPHRDSYSMSGMQGQIRETVPGDGALGFRAGDARRSHLVAFRSRPAPRRWRVGEMECDGEAAAVAEARRRPRESAFATGARYLAHEGHLLLSADTPVDISLMERSPAGSIADVSAPKACRVRLRCNVRPAQVLLDGKPVDATFDAKTSTIVLSLPAGTHEVAFGANPAVERSHPATALSLTLGERTFPLEGYARRTDWGFTTTFWGQFQVDRPGYYTLHADSDARSGGMLRLATVDGAAAKEMPDRNRWWLLRGEHSLVFETEGIPRSIRMSGGFGAIPQAIALPKEYRPAADALIVEAEKPSGEGDVKGRIVEKVGASGGLAHCNWDADGQRAEWEFEVPRDGIYRLLIRAASEEEAFRELQVDNWAGYIVGFSGTGGFCRTTDDWRVFAVVGRDGKPVARRLAPGRHVVRMRRISGAMNLDWLALEPSTLPHTPFDLPEARAPRAVVPSG